MSLRLSISAEARGVASAVAKLLSLNETMLPKMAHYLIGSIE